MKINFKTSMLFFFLIALMNITACSEDWLDPACKQLKDLQAEVEIEKQVKTALSNFLNEPEVSSELVNKHGGIFKLYKLSHSHKPYFSHLGDYLDIDNMDLFFNTDQNANSFKKSAIFIEVGIGYGRAQLLFKNENQKPIKNGVIPPFKFGASSKVICEINPATY